MITHILFLIENKCTLIFKDDELGYPFVGYKTFVGLNIHLNKSASNLDPLILNIHLTRYNGWAISNKYANNW